MATKSIGKKSKEPRYKTYPIGASSPQSKAVIDKFDEYVHRYGRSRVDLLAACVRILTELDNLGVLDRVVKGEKRIAEVFTSEFKIRSELDRHLKEISIILEDMLDELRREKSLVNKSKVIDNLTSTLARLATLDKVSLEEIDVQIQAIHQERMKILRNTLPSYEISERE